MDNDLTRKGQDIIIDKDHVMKDRKFISFMEEIAITPILSVDVQKTVLNNFLRPQGFGLTFWDQFERNPSKSGQERLVCALEGTEDFKLISPAFRQNLYSGVYHDLEPSQVPADLSLIKIDAEKYPLLEEVKDHI